MKQYARYWLFSGEFYYATGGANDLICCGDDLHALIAIGREAVSQPGINSKDWWHILDVKLGNIVAGTEAQAYGAQDLELNHL